MKQLMTERIRLKAYRRIRSFFAKLLIFALLLGFAYIILYPFLFKLLISFMSREDMHSALVELIPMHWTLETYRFVVLETEYLPALGNTLLYALTAGLLGTLSAAMVGYGLAKFRFRGVRLLTVVVIVIMLMPLQTLSIPIYLNFHFFDILGLFRLFGGEGINLLDTVWPLIIMSATGFGFRAGVFIILMRQYYLGVPNELIEAAYVDGSGPYRTFVRIILPMAKSMLIVVFSLAFAWQWTDTFLASLLHRNVKLLPNLVLMLNTTTINDTERYMSYVQANTAAILAIVPLILFYCLLQKQIIQGIERSGLVG